tara:strand:- start:509 stop:619 length:111 start_codon:yes stop_codon:yes gene_type:complete
LLEKEGMDLDPECRQGAVENFFQEEEQRDESDSRPS